jgi:hypothetical protein
VDGQVVRLIEDFRGGTSSPEFVDRESARGAADRATHR